MDIEEIKHKHQYGEHPLTTDELDHVFQELEKLQQENERYKEVLRKIEQESVVWEELCRDTLKS